MSSKDIFDVVVPFFKVSIIDSSNTIQKQMQLQNSKFENLETYDDISQTDELNNCIVIANIIDDKTANEIEELASKNKDTIFLTVSKNSQNTAKLNNIQNVTNIKTIDNKLLKIYKDKYTKGNLCLKFCKDINYNLREKKLFNNSQEVHLTQRELDLLVLLLKNTNNIVLHKTIQAKIWHESYDVSDSAYKSLLNKLRGKIGKKAIKSVSRKGYVINFE